MYASVIDAIFPTSIVWFPPIFLTSLRQWMFPTEEWKIKTHQSAIIIAIRLRSDCEQFTMHHWMFSCSVFCCWSIEFATPRTVCSRLVEKTAVRVCCADMGVNPVWEWGCRGSWFESWRCRG